MNLGKILKVNQNFQTIFHYTQEEIINRDVNCLMPEIYAKKHKAFIEEFIKEGRSKALYKQIFVFASTKEGYIFPVWLILKQITPNSGGIEYISLIKPIVKRGKPVHYIILNERGYIEGISERLKD